MTGRCDQCKKWVYRYPDDMGVCTNQGGPLNGKGFGVPIESAVISKSLRTKHAGNMATSCDTQCDAWEAE